MHVARSLVAAALLCVSASIAFAGRPVRLNELPPAVQSAVHEQLRGATLVGLFEERRKGTVVYEVETTLNGNTRDLILSATGTILQIEEEVALATVPAEVQAALTARGKVLKVEVVIAGTTVTYEGQVEGKGKKSEVVVDAHGRVPRQR